MKKLKRIRLEKALNESFGAWKDKDHSELRKGTNAYVRSLRKSSPFTHKIKTDEFYVRSTTENKQP